MKNLIDELHSLDKEEFSVSPSFSKNVMKNIKLNKRVVVFTRVVSMLSCACLLFMCVFFANKTGLFNNVKNSLLQKNTSADNASIDFAQTSNVETINEASIEEESLEYNTQVDNSQYLEDTSYDTMLARGVEDEKQKQPLATTNSAFKTIESEKRYVKIIRVSEEFEKEEYINEISNVLKENGFEFEIQENRIVLNVTETEAIQNLLIDYVDVDVIAEDGKVVVLLKN